MIYLLLMHRYHFPDGWRPRCPPHFFTIIKRAVHDILKDVFPFACESVSLGHVPRSEMVQLWGNYIFSFTRYQ